ncbi:MAG: ferrous iron transport protein B [Chloroflexi bacterium]|nr:ferrous iron transport protein B [Chloroflexota bacterium]
MTSNNGTVNITPNLVDYGRLLETEIQKLETEIARHPAARQQYPIRWLAINLLEQDQELQSKLMQIEGGAAILTHAQLSYAHLQKVYEEDIDILIADHRYQFIHAVVGDVMQTSGAELTLTDKIDRIVTHRIFGIPIFLIIMWTAFKITADVSAPFLDWVEGVIGGSITNWATAILTSLSLDGTWFESLILDGVIAGVGGVLVFVPVLMSLYITLAILEDTGYMARAAFVMDGLMTKIGLQGKSFLPMMVGFGCSVPAIYATRTLENEKDRILTGLLVPFISCGARLPVYVLFAAVFFSANAGAVIFSMYLLGILTAVVIGLILRKTLFKDKEQTALLMELPPYRRPNWKTIWTHTWERTSSFIKSAWTIILVTSVILWLLMAIPVGTDAGTFADTAVDQSLFATVSSAISPAFKPMGFGSWQSTGALITGFVAKEVVVSTIAQTYGLEEAEETAEPTTFLQDVGGIFTSLGTAVWDTLKAIPLIVGIDLVGTEEEDVSGLQESIFAGFQESSNGHGALAGLAFMVFVLIYTPCMVAIAAEKQELGTKWMWISIIGQFVLAWLMALTVYQGGLLIGLG